MTVLIPAYQPDNRLIELIRGIRQKCSFDIIIVDDGSGQKYKEIFDTAKRYGCTVLTHLKNMGKGCALKTGFKYLIETGKGNGIVCADSDGQHTPDDIINVSGNIDKSSSEIILGCRHFTGKVPFKSRLGNTLTRLIYTFSTGLKVYDIQTGLRGFTPDMLDWLCQIPGERFEYEMNMLLDAGENGFIFKEVGIDTLYLENNSSTHFHVIKDSLKVWLPILKFSASSLVSGILDFVLLVVMKLLTSDLLLSVVIARAVSSVLNYGMNNFIVFSKSSKLKEVKKTMPKYFTVVLLVLICNYGLMFIFNEIIGIPLFFSKIMTEAFLFIFSYWSQRKFVFKMAAHT